MKVYTKIVIQESEFRKLLSDWYFANGEEAISEIIIGGHLKSCHSWSDTVVARFEDSLAPIKELTVSIDIDIVAEAVKIHCIRRELITADGKMYIDNVKMYEDSPRKEVAIEFHKTSGTSKHRKEDKQ